MSDISFQTSPVPRVPRPASCVLSRLASRVLPACRHREKWPIFEPFAIRGYIPEKPSASPTALPGALEAIRPSKSMRFCASSGGSVFPEPRCRMTKVIIGLKGFASLRQTPRKASWQVKGRFLKISHLTHQYNFHIIPIYFNNRYKQKGKSAPKYYIFVSSGVLMENIAKRKHVL